MSDIDFDELDKAVGKLMNEHEENANSKTDDQAVAVKTPKTKKSTKPVARRGRFMDFVPRQPIKASPKPVVKKVNISDAKNDASTAKLNTAQQEKVEKFVKNVEQNIDQKPAIKLEKPKKRQIIQADEPKPAAKTLLNHKKPSELNQENLHVSLDEKPQDLKTFPDKTEAKTEPVSDAKAEKPQPEFTDSKAKRQQLKEYNSPFIRETEIKKRPLGGPEIGRQYDPSLDPEVRSSSVLGEKEQTPIYQSEVQIVDQKKKKSSILGWTLWILFLISLGVGIGILLFENPFGWQLPDFF